MLSKKGCIELSKGFAEGQIERGDIDLAFVAWLTKPNIAQRVGACYVYPPMGGYYQQASECDATHFKEDKGGRRSAWTTSTNGTRVSTDPHSRVKWLVQWTPGGHSCRKWLWCPPESFLLNSFWKWRSCREPTASDPSVTEQETSEETKGETQKEEEETASRSQGSKGTQRQMKRLDKFRVWVDNKKVWDDDPDEAQVIWGFWASIVGR